MDRPDWVPAGIDIDRPSAARMYDYYLGGSHNFAPDREAAKAVMAIAPAVAASARANRDFLRRVVRHLVAAGIRQFLDIGSGMPTAGNVHEVAERDAPQTHVVYVDSDPVAVAHSQHLLDGNERVIAVQGDLRDVTTILTDPRVTDLIDFDQPVGVLLMSVLHFVSDEAAPGAELATIRERLAPGSYLAISHGTAAGHYREARDAAGVYQRTAYPLTMRTREEITAFFAGFELLDPGVAWVPLWRPDSSTETWTHPERGGVLGGVGRLE